MQFFTDPSEFLDVAGDYLAAAPVINTVVTTTTHKQLAQRTAGIAPPQHNWWVVVRDDSGAIVGVAMRTAPFAPYPPYLLPMPDDAAVALARVLHESGEEVLAISGALPATQLCADEIARLGGGRVEVGQPTRLHELGDLVWPKPVAGGLRCATVDDIELVTEWFAAFGGDADEQAGRPRGASAHDLPDRAEMLRRLESGLVWFWVDESGTPVHLTGVNAPAFGVVRVGPVYTPPEQRGRGLASNAVAQLSQQILDSGARACLFTDQSNPTSNRVYAALGYEPVADMVNLVIVR